MNLFYADPTDIHGQRINISGQEAVHITKVLRHSVGDSVFVTDGAGSCYECRISDFKKSSVFLEILKSESEDLRFPGITLCMGVIKKRDRLEFAVEKAVELGVSKIILFTGEHSQKGNVRKDRLESTAVAAMKQSLRYSLPEIVVEKTLQDALSNHSKDSAIVVADETSEMNATQKTASKNFFLIVGPEGGFSESERECLETFKPDYYSLGEKRLRTETAAMIMVDRFANQE